MKSIFLLLLFSLPAKCLDYPEPFFFWDIEPVVSMMSKGKPNIFTTADWVEIQLTISTDKKITKTSILNSSGYHDFNQAQLHNLLRFERFVTPAKLNGEFIESNLVVRLDYLHWQGLNRIHTELEILESQVLVPNKNKQKKFLITVQNNLKQESFKLKEIPVDSDLKVFEIETYFSDPNDYGFIKRQPKSFEQLENNGLISQVEFKKAVQAYSPVDPMMSITVFQGKIMNSHEVNELQTYENKFKYRFKRFEFSKPSFNEIFFFTDFNAELALNSYIDVLEFTATVLPSGRIENIKFVKPSRHERLNSIVVEALENKYIIPAYTNYQPVKDEIRVRLKLNKDI